MKKFIAVLLAGISLLAMVGCGAKTDDSTTTKPAQTEAKTEAPTDAPTDAPEPEGTITINFHYLREDGAYSDWDLWAWCDGSEGSAYAFGTETDDNGVVTTFTVPAGTAKIGYIVRKPDWSEKDVAEDQFIELSITTGTVDVYVVSLVPGCTINLGDDCVTN